MSKETGGPAFPRPFSVDDVDSDITYPANVGMTLRDYFAAKAMQALVSDKEVVAMMGSREFIAESAYKMADEMLKAREQ